MKNLKKLIMAFAMVFVASTAQATPDVSALTYPQILYHSPDTKEDVVAYLGCEKFMQLIDITTSEMWEVATCGMTPTYNKVWPIEMSAVNGLVTTLEDMQDDIATMGGGGVTLPIAESDVTSLVSDLAAKVPATRTVNGHALSSNVTVAYSELASIPSTFAPSAHNHAASEITSGTKTSAFISDFDSHARGLHSVTGNGSYNSSTGAIAINYPSCYIGTTLLSNCFPIAKSATVASGNAVFYLTSDGTSTGTALYPTGAQVDSIQLRCDNEASAPCSFGTPALSNSNKTVTVAVNKTTGVNVALVGLTLLGAPAAANGTVVKMTVLGN